MLLEIELCLGHESNACPKERTADSRFRYAHSNGSRLIYDLGKQCYHCQGLGHVQADCPTLRIGGNASTRDARCYSCNQPGHIAVSTALI